MNETPILVVIGPPGAGKSVIGRRIARELRVPFVDTDRRIVAKHGPIVQIFSEHGEAWFRAVERIEVARALTEPSVVALGGGAVLNPETQEDLANRRVLLVTVTPQAVEGRLASSPRPLLKEGLQSWIKLVEERSAIYKSLATRTIDSSVDSAAVSARQIAQWIREESQT